ncbi:MAG TPA: aldo/keto reductase [Verrucomicrobiae bacterium]|nr:aldo/keto reductase [Verrucomicrobiae bacterium]
MFTKRAFGNTGLSVSPLGFGSAPVGFLEKDSRRAGEILNFLLDHGVNVIDTAECYAGAEDMIGQTVAHRRNDYVLITKCGHKFPGADGADWSPQLIRQSVESSLRRLRTDHLDVVLMHTPSLDVLKKGDVMAALVESRDAGKIRFLGFSGDNDDAAYAAGLPDVRVIETSLNICDQTNIEKVLPVATKRGLGVIAKRPIANSAWLPATALRGFYGDYSRPYAERLQKMEILPGDLGFDGAPPPEIWPEIALRFTLSIPEVHTAIVGTTKLDNARVNLDNIKLGPLPDVVVGKIRGAFTEAQKRTGEIWLGLT